MSKLGQAFVLALFCGLWLLSGLWKAPTPEIIDSFGEVSIDPVRVELSKSETFSPQIDLLGITEAERSVLVRSRVAGTLIKLPTEGSFANKGDVLCRLDEEARAADVKQAKAALNRAELDWEGTQKLKSSDLTSDLQIAQARANLDTAKAVFEKTSLMYSHTLIRAPYSGVIDAVPSRLGALMNPGDVCAKILDLDPITIKSNIPEIRISEFQEGDRVQVRLLSGEQAYGRIAWISKSADSTTRTFQTKIVVPNPDGDVLEGVSSSVTLFGKETQVHKISPASLVFDEKGILIVKVVDLTNRVREYPVKILKDSQTGMYISGLPDEVRLIVIGQHRVAEGVKVLARTVGSQTG